jgi:hypothetical protein
MNVLPPGEQLLLLLDHDPNGSANLTVRHAVSPDQFSHAIGTQQIYLRVTVTEDVDVGWRVIVNEDDHTQAASTKHGDHVTR